MKKGIAVFVLSMLTTHMLWAQQPLAITRVLLYKNGMAYIVRSGQIAAPVSLTFHPQDMNDVLKSFTAWNPDSKELYSVGYTTGIPSSHMLARFPFDISRPETGLGGFLVQVKGAEVKLDNNGKDVQGKLVAAQETQHVTAPQTSSTDYRLTVMMKDGSLQTMWLSDVRSVEFVDPQLREQLRSYLEVLSSGRQDVTREVTVYPVPAAGPIQVSYLQQFPLWKTSYRVDLGAKESQIQGWAQIDNPTGEAWDNVKVSLLSGAPVSFVMNLYDPLYTNRTTVAVPSSQVAAPRQYESAVSVAKAESFDTVSGLAERTFAESQAGARGRGGAPAGGAGGGRGGGGGAGGPAAAGALRLLADSPSVGVAQFQQADSARVEDFFEYQFPFPVRIASRQSALLPFLQRQMNIEKLSIFNARTDRSNPRLGARMDNNTDVPFEAGPVTFFQDSRYTGEAVLEYLPRGDKRFVSYGVDYDIQIANKQQARPETTQRISVSKGVAVLFMETIATTTYEIRNKGTEKKSLVVEHPRFNNRTLPKGVEPFETTDSFYRFRVNLDAGKSAELEVPEIVARQTTISLHTLTRPQLTMFAGRETPAAVREKLGQIVDVQERIATLEAEVRSTQGTIDTLFRDQERLRENIKALKETADDLTLRTRYLDQLKRQEDRIDTSRARIDTLNKEIETAQTRLSDLISNLAYGA